MKNAQISHGPKNSITAIMLFLHGALHIMYTADFASVGYLL